MKYYHIQYTFRDGQHEYTCDGLLACHHSDNPRERFEELHLAEMWGEYTEKEEGKFCNVFWSDTREVCCWIDKVTQITKHEYIIMKKYHFIKIYAEPKPEQISFS